MFSNDQNIETIGQLVDVLKHYAGHPWSALGVRVDFSELCRGVCPFQLLGTSGGVFYRGRRLFPCLPIVHHLQEELD